MVSGISRSMSKSPGSCLSRVTRPGIVALDMILELRHDPGGKFGHLSRNMSKSPGSCLTCH